MIELKGASRAAGIIAVAGVTCAVACASPAAAEEIHVYPGESIQEAITLANDGDEVIVHPGTYFESLNMLGRAITLRSLDPGAPGIVEDTIIDASNFEVGSVILCNSGESWNTVIDGFTLRGGNGTVFGGDLYGGGVFVKQAGLTLQRCRIIDNSADTGGGLSNFMGWPHVIECHFEGNVAEGGTVHGGGGLKSHSGNIKISRCTFRDNSSSAAGGGLRILGGDADIINCLVVSNSAIFGGGMDISTCEGIIINCTIADNTAIHSGGGVRFLNTTDNLLVNSIVWNNTSDNCNPQICQAGTSDVDVLNSVVEGGYPGDGNNGNDPDLSADFKLLPNSDAIDSGDTSMIEELQVNADLDYACRVIGGTVDRGAYEWYEVYCDPDDPEPTCVAADIDNNGFVETSDLLQLLADWGACPEGMPGCQGDINEDGMVATDDLLELLSMWGPCEDG